MLMDEPTADPKGIGDIMTYIKKKITTDFGYE
jgi:energy-coupling factor transporter ATP-binding protein EcfA2